jgi:hypothetical protein
MKSTYLNKFRIICPFVRADARETHKKLFTLFFKNTTNHTPKKKKKKKKKKIDGNLNPWERGTIYKISIMTMQ